MYYKGKVKPPYIYIIGRGKDGLYVYTIVSANEASLYIL
jgi:hypothetical protein